MNKIEVLTKKLEEVRVEYFGLTLPMRQAILDAMEEYTDQDRMIILGLGKKNTGLKMVVRERMEMIQKHGKTIGFDIKNNNCSELRQSAIACLTAQADFPRHWNKADTDHIRFDKPEIERLAIAAAFCVAEIDRLLNK